MYTAIQLCVYVGVPALHIRISVNVNVCICFFMAPVCVVMQFLIWVQARTCTCLSAYV